MHFIIQNVYNCITKSSKAGRLERAATLEGEDWIVHMHDANQQDQHKKEAELQIWGWNPYLLFQQHKGSFNGRVQP